MHSKESSSDARALALSILNALEDGRRTLDRVVDEKMTPAVLPDRRERALTTMLVYGVLRHRNTLDWLIKKFSRTSFDGIEPIIKNILRLSLFQIRYLDRVPDYAVVNAAVNMARAFSSPRASGFVNGLLRNVVRHQAGVVLPDVRTHGVEALSVVGSLPEWLLQRWVKRYGLEQTAGMCELINSVPPVTVRVNTLKTTVARARELLAGEVSSLRDGLYAPHALRFYAPEKPVDALESFQRGWFQVQDESAQLLCRYFNPQPGESILDACAGRGGKTGHIAQLMNNQGHILALDKSPRKLAVLEAEMKRLGVTMVDTTAANLLKKFTLPGPARYDRVLADCPCSGMGVLRNNPDTRWRLSPGDLIRHHRTQVALLDRLAPLVRPGGLLVYAVCSLETEENERVVDAFLNIHPEFDMESDIQQKTGGLVGVTADFVDRNGFFKSLILPHRLDGFFGARLKRKP